MDVKLRLRYEFDAGSGVCLWAGNALAEKSYGDAIVADVLPISTNLRCWLQHLIAWYDTSLDWENPGGPSPWSAAERQRFHAAARRGLLSLRGELPEHFAVEDAVGE